MPTHQCTCEWAKASRCLAHPEKKPIFRGMFPTSDHGNNAPASRDFHELSAEWEDGLKEAESMRAERVNMTINCPDCRFGDPCSAHAGGSC